MSSHWPSIEHTFCRNQVFWRDAASPHFERFFWEGSLCLLLPFMPWKITSSHFPTCGLPTSTSSTPQQSQGFYQPHPCSLQGSRRTHVLEDSQIQRKTECCQVMTSDTSSQCNRITFRRWKKKKIIYLVGVFLLGDRRGGFGWLPPMLEPHTLSTWTRPNFIDFITLPRSLAWLADCNPRRCSTLTFS